MALSFVGSAENSGVDGSIDLSVTLPGGVAEGDVIYFAGGTSKIGAQLDISMVTAGYTELADLYADDTVDMNYGLFRKIMGASPDSTAVLDGNGPVSAGIAAVLHVWRGVDQTTPEDAATTTAVGINGGIPDSPSITTVTADAVVISTGGSTQADTTITGPSGYSNQVDRDAVGSALEVTLMMASKSIASPAAENPAAWGLSGDSGGDCWCAATIAVRPAVVAGGFIDSMLAMF